MVFLIADDDADDHEFFRESAKKAIDDCYLIQVFNGQQALHYLLGEGDYSQSQRKRPDVIILDLNMPKLNGVETLKEIKQQPSLSQIPVYILTTSWEEKYMHQCRILGATGYFTKPNQTKILDTIVRQIVTETQSKF